MCYRDLHDYKNAIKYLKQHIANRNFKTPSIYSLTEVNEKLKDTLDKLNKIK